MTIVFKYKNVKRPDGTLVKTPSVPITFIGKESLDVTALLDSGADISVIPKEIAEILGLNISGDVTPAYGIGGKVNSVETKVNILIEKGHERYNFSIPIKVILDEYDFPILLGREGFFNNFVISFDQKEERVMLKRKN